MRSPRFPVLLSAPICALALVATACGGSDAPTLVDAAPTSSTLTPTVSDLVDTSTATVGDVVDRATDTVGDITDEASPPNPDPLLSSADVYTVQVVDEYAHDRSAFTQGFEFMDGRLFESRGRYGESSMTEIDPLTGDPIRVQRVTDDYFAEGFTRVGDQMILLTWREQTAFVFDADTFTVLGEHSYNGEGWGLCYDGEILQMSDGSSNLTQRDPATFEVLSTVQVVFEGTPIEALNELECIDGLVWANIWQSDTIVVIDPVTGVIVARVDASSLAASMPLEPEQVLNGIAYNEATNRLRLTGKEWPAMFEVDLVPCTGDCVAAPFPPLPAE